MHSEPAFQWVGAVIRSHSTQFTTRGERSGHLIDRIAWRPALPPSLAKRAFRQRVPLLRLLCQHASRPECSAPPSSPTATSLLVWFRRDLRLHDHPGMALALKDIQAARRDDCASPSPASLALVYVFDSEECAALPLDALEYLVGAVRCLRQTIQTDSGGRTDLYVRVGVAADQVAQLCRQLHVQKVYVEDDWSELGQQALQRARAASVPLQLWQPLRMSHLPEVNTALRDATAADDTQVTLPPVVEFFDQYQQRAVTVSLSAAEERAPFEHVLQWMQCGAARWSLPEGTTTWGEIPSAEALQPPTTIHSSSTRHLHACAGERGAERLLHSFLTTRDPVSTGTDTIRALSLPLWLGCISPHRAHAFIRAQAAAAPFDGRRGAAARDALAFLQQREWHLHLATQDRHQQHAWHYWDWQGVPIRYARWAPSTLTPASAAVLLVHGFGASIEHWQHNAEVLARHGYPVYAVDLVGFGRSMKPPALYTPDWWRQQLLDFVQQVVRQPVYVMGNSIGAYMSLSFAVAAVGATPAEATEPSRSRPDTVAAPLCRGVVLINAAGPIREPSLPPPPPPPPLSLQHPPHPAARLPGQSARQHPPGKDYLPQQHRPGRQTRAVVRLSAAAGAADQRAHPGARTHAPAAGADAAGRAGSAGQGGRTWHAPENAVSEHRAGAAPCRPLPARRSAGAGECGAVGVAAAPRTTTARDGGECAGNSDAATSACFPRAGTIVIADHRPAGNVNLSTSSRHRFRIRYPHPLRAAVRLPTTRSPRAAHPAHPSASCSPTSLNAAYVGVGSGSRLASRSLPTFFRISRCALRRMAWMRIKPPASDGENESTSSIEANFSSYRLVGDWRAMAMQEPL
eukprot:ctg_2012.g650